jgi:hypothetical protein
MLLRSQPNGDRICIHSGDVAHDVFLFSAGMSRAATTGCTLLMRPTLRRTALRFCLLPCCLAALHSAGMSCAVTLGCTSLTRPTLRHTALTLFLLPCCLASCRYELCSYYGLYVIDEANIETHGFDPGFQHDANHPAHHEAWLAALMSRATHMMSHA